MAKKESFRERQENELEVLKSIFENDDVQDLRQKSDKWTPLEVKIALTPLKGSSPANEAYARLNLHIKCGPKYPKTTPKISLEDSKGLSMGQISDLAKQLQDQAEFLKGEVMIYELTQTIQAFLHSHNKPPIGSFYDEMKRENLKREQDRETEAKELKEQERQVLMDQVLKIREQFKNEPRLRRDTRRSLSESSSKRTLSSSENSDTLPLYKSHSKKDCSEHRRSDTLYFPLIGRKIQKGSCLGHSVRGCVFYSGIDLETGQLLYITEWNVKYTELETKCLPNCLLNRSLTDQKCAGHTADEIIAYIEKQVHSLSTLHHKNLITYECVLGMKKKDGIVINLVQDFVLGTSVFGISSSIGWSSDGIRMVAKGIVDALIYLHNNGVSHSWLYDTSVFMDNTGRIRVTDFGLVSFLQELVGGAKTFKSDLLALGALIESLSINISSEMKDFIEKCRSERTLSASDLLEHPFLCPVLLDAEPTNALTLLNPPPLQPQADRPAIAAFQTPITSERSRIANEFQILSYLGRGAYGDVLKVRNILDNRQYAIKRIPLPARSRQLYRKITREVELLSRLNHENVVRYFTSWIEIGKPSDGGFNKESLEFSDYSRSCDAANGDSKRQSNRILIQEESDDSSSDDWINCVPKRVDSSSDDCIEFVDSDGEIVKYDDNDDDGDVSDAMTRAHSPRNPPKPFEMQYMYIQMEFCEKSTLRTAIDSGLYANTERLWRLFREISEGLAHIHQQGMIHRDLKPVNIFLDSRDQVKIGDFGLATTNILALQSQDQTVMVPAEAGNSQSQTGKVGTALYVAPELCDLASKSTYNQKVDLYSLGIILFEMSSPPLATGMERVKIIADLRSPAIIFPENMLADPKYTQQINVIRILLNHDPALRPTSEELLFSELVPPTKLEASELEDMIRHVLANPQSRTYKHLIARCLTQESTPVCELTYHMGMVPILSSFEFVKTKVMALFRKHGAIEVEAPLLTPYVQNNTNMVKLMTHSGSVVTLPHDLRLPFVRHVAINGINQIRRYSISRVYREKKVFNFHPKQLYECAFDIITPNRGNLLIDAELLTVAYELLHTELPTLASQNRNISFRINHTGLLRAILSYCSVPKDKYKDLLGLISDFMEDRISKFQLTSSINSLLQNAKHNTQQLLEFLQTDTPISNIHITPLRLLIRGRGEAASLAQNAIRELETVISLAQGMMNSSSACQMHIVCGLSIGYDRAKSGGIIWQMIGNLKPERHTEIFSTIAVGGRYDGLLADIQKTAQNSGLTIPNREISGAGFSFALDKLVYALGGSSEYQSIEVIVCVIGSRPPLKDVTQILRSLWAVGIRTGIIESINEEETQDMAKDLGASHVILLGEGGVLRVRTWCHDRFQEKYVTRPELIQYIQTKLRPPETNVSEIHPSVQTSVSLSAISSIKNNIYNATPNISSIASSMPALQLMFMTSEKLTANKRKRYENQIGQNLTASLNKFVKKEKVVVLVVDLHITIVKAIVGIIDPRETTNNETNESLSELQIVIERFPKQKKYISEIYDEITETLSEAKAPILGLYSIPDSYYRLIL